MLPVDLGRDGHLELLDPHLLPLLRPAKLTTDELLAAAEHSKKLVGLVGPELLERWLSPAERRYLIVCDAGRWALDERGRAMVLPAPSRLLAVCGSAAGAVGAASKFLTASAAVKAALGLALAVPGVLLIANTARFRRGRNLIRLVADKDALHRQWPR